MHVQPSQDRLLKPTTWVRLLIAGGLMCGLAVVFVAPARFGFGQPEAKSSQAESPGLRGILPAELPDDLAAEAFDPLGKDWAEWSEGVSSDLFELYEGENTSVATQRKLIASLRSGGFDRPHSPPA